jgi:uncharacterized protein YfaA (DUF2138 family)
VLAQQRELIAVVLDEAEATLERRRPALAKLLHRGGIFVGRLEAANLDQVIGHGAEF